MDPFRLLLIAIREYFSMIRASAERQQNLYEKLTDKLGEMSQELCNCLSICMTRISSILDAISIQVKEGYSSADFNLMLSSSKMIEDFRAVRSDYYSMLDNLWTIDRNEQDFNESSSKLQQTLDDFDELLHDTYTLTILAQGSNATLSSDNSSLLEDIYSIISDPKNNIDAIISLRFGEGSLRDYYNEVRGLCNHLAETVELPYHNSYSVDHLTPFRAIAGSPEQRYLLGVRCLDQGKREDAIFCFEKAIEKGDLNAYHVLGNLFIREGNDTVGITHLKYAADNGHEASIFDLGMYHFVHKDYEEAVDYLSRLSGHRREAEYYLGKSYDALLETEKSVTLFSELVGVPGAKLDIYSAASMFQIVEAHFDLRIPQPDWSSVLDFYDRVENEVQCEDGMSCDFIKTLIPLQRAKILQIQEEYEKSLAIYQSFINADSPIAECELGWIYYMGLGVKKDYDLAYHYFNQSARHHYPDSYVGLAICSVVGTHKVSDHKIALSYLKTAAKYGVKLAYLYLTALYKVDIPSYVGEGAKEDGIEYEKKCREGLFRYYYVSVLDHHVYEAELSKGFYDITPNSIHNPLLWWVSTERSHIYDAVMEYAKTGLSNEESFFNNPPYIVITPKGTTITAYPGDDCFVTLLYGRISVDIYDIADTDPLTPGDWITRIDLSHSDTLHSFFIAQGLLWAPSPSGDFAILHKGYLSIAEKKLNLQLEGKQYEQPFQSLEREKLPAPSTP